MYVQTYSEQAEIVIFFIIYLTYMDAKYYYFGKTYDFSFSYSCMKKLDFGLPFYRVTYFSIGMHIIFKICTIVFHMQHY